MDKMTMAKSLLDEGDCTLVVVGSDWQPRKFHNRGVRDLLALLDCEPQWLLGATVADKIVGKAAAAMMIEGQIKEVYARAITRDARAMLEAADIAVAFGKETDMVANRTKTGRCPIYTLCAGIADPRDMVAAARQFTEQCSTAP